MLIAAELDMYSSFHELRAAPSKYRLWPCKIEKSDVLKLFLVIALGPPITEIAILIGSGKFFFLI